VINRTASSGIMLTEQMVSPNWRLHRYATGSSSVIAGRCANAFGWIGPVGVLAMNSVHHGWFFQQGMDRVHRFHCRSMAADDDCHIRV
jgi:hypothetical protein